MKHGVDSTDNADHIDICDFDFLVVTIYIK